MLSTSMNKKNIDEHKTNNKNTNIDVEDYYIYTDTNDMTEDKTYPAILIFSLSLNTSSYMIAWKEKIRKNPMMRTTSSS